MKTDRSIKSLTTMELALGLATNTFSSDEKLEVLSIISSRETATKMKLSGETVSPKLSNDEINSIDEIISNKAEFKKGSKSEKINELLSKGKSIPEIYKELEKLKLKVNNSEIYRIKNIRENS